VKRLSAVQAALGGMTLTSPQSLIEDLVKKEYGFDGYGCGLCQTRVPCESRIPAR